MPPISRSTRSKRTKTATRTNNNDDVSSTNDLVSSEAKNNANELPSTTVLIRKAAVEVVVKTKATRNKPTRSCKRNVVEEEIPDTRPKRSKRLVNKAVTENVQIASEEVDCVKVKKEDMVNGDEAVVNNEEPIANCATSEEDECKEKVIQKLTEVKVKEINDEINVKDVNNVKDALETEPSPSSTEMLKPQIENEATSEKNADINTETTSKKKSKVSDDNKVEFQCRCSKKIQLFGPFSEGTFSSKKMLGEGVEIFKSLKHENSLLAGYVKIHKDSSLSGKAKNNTVYFVLEGSVRAEVSGKVKNLKKKDCFMILQDVSYDITNTGKQHAELNFVKISRDI